MNRVASLVAAGLLFGVVGGASAAGKPVDLALHDLTGARVHLRDLRGKIVVLNFWATWCGPCRHEFPLLVHAKREMRPRGVIFIGASLDSADSRKAIPAFLERFHAEFPVWTGATADDMDRLGMGAAVPATAFLDESGIIVARVSGEIREAS